MVVVKHETNTKNPKNSFCYDATSDTLQFSEDILNELETTRNSDIPKYAYFEQEMEKIEAGDTSNTAAVKLDEFIGSIGISDTNIREIGGRFNGIC